MNGSYHESVRQNFLTAKWGTTPTERKEHIHKRYERLIWKISNFIKIYQTIISIYFNIFHAYSNYTSPFKIDP